MSRSNKTGWYSFAVASCLFLAMAKLYWIPFLNYDGERSIPADYVWSHLMFAINASSGLLLSVFGLSVSVLGTLLILRERRQGRLPRWACNAGIGMYLFLACQSVVLVGIHLMRITW